MKVVNVYKPIDKADDPIFLLGNGMLKRGESICIDLSFDKLKDKPYYQDLVALVKEEFDKDSL